MRPLVNPINNVPFGAEKSREELLARAAWEYDQAAMLLAKQPTGYSVLAAEHERKAKAYTRRAQDQQTVSRTPARTAQTPQSDAELREQLITLLEVHNGNVYAVAKALGKRVGNLVRTLKRLEIQPESFWHKHSGTMSYVPAKDEAATLDAIVLEIVRAAGPNGIGAAALRKAARDRVFQLRGWGIDSGKIDAVAARALQAGLLARPGRWVAVPKGP